MASGVKYLVGTSAGRSGLIAAFVATHVATVAGLWFHAAGLPVFDFNTLNGLLYLGPGSLPDLFGLGISAAATIFVVGGVIHYVNGILWGLIFALVVHPMMGRWIKALAPLTPTVNYVKGLLWGWTLWIISSAIWMPLVVGTRLAPVGPFLTSFGDIGFQALFANLLWHTIYGLHLGLLFSPTPGSGGASVGRGSA